MGLELTRGRPETNRSTLLAIAALCGSMLCFQFGASIAKSLFPMVGAEGATTLRQSFAALLLVLVMRPWRRPLSARYRLSLLLYGTALGIMNLTFYMALRTIPLGIAVALEFIGPLTVAMFSIRRFADGVWILFAVLGLALLLPLGTSINGIDPRGAALALAAGGCWAMYIIFGKRAGSEHGTHAVTYGAVIAALVAAPIGVWHAGAKLIDPAILPLALVVGALSSAIPYSLEMVALTRIPARAYSTFTSVEPAVGALTGMAVMHEALSFAQWIGVLSVVLASAGTAASIKPAETIAPNEDVPR